MQTSNFTNQYTYLMMR